MNQEEQNEMNELVQRATRNLAQKLGAVESDLAFAHAQISILQEKLKKAEEKG